MDLLVILNSWLLPDELMTYYAGCFLLHDRYFLQKIKGSSVRLRDGQN